MKGDNLNISLFRLFPTSRRILIADSAARGKFGLTVLIVGSAECATAVPL